MRPLPTPALLRALRLLLPLAACVWGPAIAPRNSLGVSPYWNNVDTPVHLFTLQNGFYLEMLPDGKVGRTTFQTPYTALIVRPVQPHYIIFIGAKSKLNLCMRPNGNLFGMGSFNQDDCTFKQIRFEPSESIYESYKHKILLSLGGGKGPYVPNAKLPRFSQFMLWPNEVPESAIYPPQHQ